MTDDYGDLTRCHMMLDDDTQCPAPAIVAGADMLICEIHAELAYNMVENNMDLWPAVFAAMEDGGESP